MSFLKRSEKRLNKYWTRKLPSQEKNLPRYAKTGLLPQDHHLSNLEIICAISMMAENKTIHEVHRAIELFRNESTEEQIDDPFLEKLQETIEELDGGGMRSQARKLRKIGHGIATMQNNSVWETHWSGEIDKKRSSAIKDEPFLPQKG